MLCQAKFSKGATTLLAIDCQHDQQNLSVRVLLDCTVANQQHTRQITSQSLLDRLPVEEEQVDLSRRGSKPFVAKASSGQVKSKLACRKLCFSIDISGIAIALCTLWSGRLEA